MNNRGASQGRQWGWSSRDGRAFGDSEQGFSTRGRMDHRDMSQRYGNQFSRSQGHSQSPLPASSYSNEQPRRRGNQEAEIPLGILVDLFTQMLRQVSRIAQPEESLNMEYLKILKTMKGLETYKFKGGINTFEAEEWMHMMDINFEAMICPEKYKKRVAVYYLQGDARNWWESVERQHGNHITSWDVFQKEFRRKYFPPEARHRLERQFINLTQGDRTVREYKAEFTSLRCYVFNGQENEATMI